MDCLASVRRRQAASGSEGNSSGGDGEEGVLRLDRRDGFVLRHSFDARPGSVGLARDAAALFLGALADTSPSNDERVAGDILLAVSELVTNVVRHTAGTGTLVMAYREGQVQIVVRDTSTASPPADRPPRLDGRGGLGWPLLQALAASLTVVPLSDGKEIHAHVTWPTEPGTR